MSTGKFVTLEGCEGVGKSTQVDLLKKAFAGREDVIFLREPGGTAVSESIRRVILDVDNYEMVPRCEAMLYSASRAQLVEQVIKPALEEGKIVFCDRFTDSTLAYQGYARGLDKDFIRALGDMACNGLKPDVTIFLDLSPAKSFARKGGADKDDRLEQAGMAFHEKVYEGYCEIARTDPLRVVRIDAGESIQDIHSAIMRVLADRGVR